MAITKKSLTKTASTTEKSAKTSKTPAPVAPTKMNTTLRALKKATTRRAV